MGFLENPDILRKGRSIYEICSIIKDKKEVLSMGIPPGLMDLDTLLAGDKLFEIPIYQRPYAWDEKKQISDLFDDISFQGRGKSHFFGTLLLKYIGVNDSGLDIYEVVDGQQRLVTVIVLMNELIKILDNYPENKKKRLEERYVKIDNFYKLKICNEDRLFFQNNIIDDVSGPNDPQTPSQKRLLKAKEFIKTELVNLNDNDRADWVNKIKKFVSTQIFILFPCSRPTLL